MSNFQILRSTCGAVIGECLRPSLFRARDNNMRAVSGDSMQPRLTAVLVEKFGHAFSDYDLITGERRFSVALPQYPHEFVVDRESGERKSPLA
jgi:hypothetical protein